MLPNSIIDGYAKSFKLNIMVCLPEDISCGIKLGKHHIITEVAREIEMGFFAYRNDVALVVREDGDGLICICLLYTSPGTQ